MFGRNFRSIGHAGILLLQFYGLLQEVFLLGLVELLLLNLESALPHWFDDAGGAGVGIGLNAFLLDPDPWFLDHNVGARSKLDPLPSQLLLPFLQNMLLDFLLSRQREKTSIKVVCMGSCRMLFGNSFYFIVCQSNRISSPDQ